MEFRLLGPVELWSAGRRHTLGSIKERCVLAVLLLNLETIVPTDTLIARVWDDDPPAKARQSLSAYATRLRRVLREVAGDRVRLEGQAHGYRLYGDPALIDLYHFRRMWHEATALAVGGDLERAASLLRSADQLWRGEPLAGLPGDSMARIRHSLAEERRAATRERIEVELGLGRHADLVGEIARLSAQYQTDESLTALQMRALYLSGRQGDALDTYRQLRQTLIRELGTEPGPALSELHERILRRDSQLAPPPPAHESGPAFAPDTLPTATSDFVGRTAEISRLTAGGDGNRVMLITGMPGIGKTSLAVASAHAVRASFPGGRLFLSLNAHDPRNPPLDTASALHRLLRMLDVPTGRIPHVLERRSAMWRAEMARRQLMVVLDDVADAAQVRPLLPPASGCKFIITSRDRLIGVATAVPLVLGALPTPEGVHLFTQVAGPSGAEASGMAEEIVQRCVGHPLAIRLAALSLRDGHPATAAELLDELVRPPGVSDVGDGVSDQILAVFELSYQGLAESARRMLRRLALHPGTDITTYAAAALDGATLPQAEAALAMLTDRNLLAGSRELFRLHDLVRRYAAARASRDDPERAVRQAFDRLADYYRLSLKQANRVRNPATPAPAEPAPARPVSIPPMETPLEASGWLELEWHNVLCTARQAAKRERKNHCAGLIHALSQWLEATGHWNEAAESHALALQASRELGDERGAARACLDLSLVSRATGRAADALLHAEAAAARYRRLADQIGLADALNQIGTLHKDAARYREALAYHKEAREFYGAAGHVPGVASTLNQSGIACCHLGRYRIATDHIQSALGIFRQLGDRRGEAKTLNNLGRIYRNQGYHRDALRSYQDALKIFDEIGGEQSQSILCQNIGGVHHYKGNHEKAIVSYRRALAICRRIGDLPGEVNVLNDMGVTFQAMDDHAEALANHQRAEVMATELGDLNERVTALRGMADAYRGQGHHGEALDHYERALRLSREISEPYQEGKVLNGIAETTLQTQGAEAARIYWHQAYDLFQQLGVAEAETVRLRLDTLPPEQPSGVS